MRTQCPSCKSDSAFIGDIPSNNYFAGRVLNYEIAGGGLYKCNKCSLHYRHPRLSKSELDELYRKGDPFAWRYKLESRVDWQVAISFIKDQFGQGKVLDIGCFDGAFLKHLGKDFDRYGVEISKGAIDRAMEEGIGIAATDFEELERLEPQFDVVAGFDIIEHVEDPLMFLNLMNNLIRKGGFYYSIHRQHPLPNLAFHEEQILVLLSVGTHFFYKPRLGFLCR